MEEVFPLVTGSKYKTQIWVSQHVVAQIRAECEDPDSLAEKIEGCARVGFSEVSDNIFRHEGTDGGGETWRFAHKNSSLFRLVGFVESNRKAEFIVLDAFQKDTADGYSAKQWARMKEISDIKRG